MRRGRHALARAIADGGLRGAGAGLGPREMSMAPAGYCSGVNEQPPPARLADRLARARRMRIASMGAESFRIAVHEDDGHPRVVLGGDVDIAALPSLRAVLRSLIARRPERLEIDLGDVDLVETVTAAFLARQQAAARAAGTELVLRAPQRVPSRLLSMAGAEVDGTTAAATRGPSGAGGLDPPGEREVPA
jgi:anti-anti-sigma factor